MHILDQQGPASTPRHADEEGTEAVIARVLADKHDPSDFRITLVGFVTKTSN